jgi:hypothetical protein
LKFLAGFQKNGSASLSLAVRDIIRTNNPEIIRSKETTTNAAPRKPITTPELMCHKYSAEENNPQETAIITKARANVLSRPYPLSKIRHLARMIITTAIGKIRMFILVIFWICADESGLFSLQQEIYILNGIMNFPL